MKTTILTLFSASAILASTVLAFSQSQQTGTNNVPRGQWSTAEAWAWNDKVGVIRGFNALGHAYPGMSDADVMRKAKSLGYNSVRVGDYYGVWRRSPSDAKQRVHRLLDLAQENGLTVCPVMFWNSGSISGGRAALQETNTSVWTSLQNYIQDMVGEFRSDPRIVLWDLFNEPGEPEYRLARQLILWSREVNPTQPLTSSVFWTGPNPSPRQVEVEEVADVHNFHLYDGSSNQMGRMEAMIQHIKQVSDRPILCTECLARTKGDSFGRILATFSKYHVHWYNWGLYTGDANWLVSWQRSSFEPYQPWFHDVLHPDGEPYDWRDLELIRSFHFAKDGEESDPGVEITDRWLKERAWQWFVMGPMRGRTYRPGSVHSWHDFWMLDMAKTASIEDELAKAQETGCDGLRVRLDFEAWKADHSQFCKRVGDFLAIADRHAMTVTPVLLSDSDATHPVEELTAYVRNVVGTFCRDGRIYSWELYNRPGAGGVSSDQAHALLREIFRAARFEFPGQPLTATPAVHVEDFAPGFDYRRALAHQGGLGNHGWDRLRYTGSGDASLCAYIWQLSDVLSVASDQRVPETGWLLSIATRYGRPTLCTEWTPGDPAIVEDALKLFSSHQVRWFSTGSELTLASLAPAPTQTTVPTPTPIQMFGLLDPRVLSVNEDLSRLVKQFHFQRIMTPRQ